jgi:Uma2 family endonuclease
MSSLPQATRRYTPAEYYELERAAAYKSDYYEGELFSTAGGTGEHSLITGNVIIAVGIRLRGGPCTVRESNLRVKVMATGLRTYPDVAVYCGPVEYDPDDPERTTALNATVIFEVLSPSTEAYDRGFKAQNYRRLDSLRAYVLVAQDIPHVEVHQRQADGGWAIRDARELDGAVRIESLNVELPLAEVYDRVEFPPHPAHPSNPG